MDEERLGLQAKGGENVGFREILSSFFTVVTNSSHARSVQVVTTPPVLGMITAVSAQPRQAVAPLTRTPVPLVNRGTSGIDIFREEVLKNWITKKNECHLKAGFARAPAFQTLGAAKASQIVGEVLRDKQVTMLSLEENTGEKGKVVAFLSALPELPHLTELRVNSREFNAEETEALAGMLAKFPNLVKLHLTGNDIGDVGAKAIEAAIKTHPAITEVNIHSNIVIPPDRLEEINSICIGRASEKGTAAIAVTNLDYFSISSPSVPKREKPADQVLGRVQDTEQDWEQVPQLVERAATRSSLPPASPQDKPTIGDHTGKVNQQRSESPSKAGRSPAMP